MPRCMPFCLEFFPRDLITNVPLAYLFYVIFLTNKYHHGLLNMMNDSFFILSVLNSRQQNTFQHSVLWSPGSHTHIYQLWKWSNNVITHDKAMKLYLHEEYQFEEMCALEYQKVKLYLRFYFVRLLDLF